MSTSSTDKQTNTIFSIAIGIVIGSIVTSSGYKYFDTSTEVDTEKVTTVEKKPLYWVAPMDANYQRDKPGKSPMGMDLVPVYDDGGEGPDEGVGTIRVSSEVVNNLGVRTTTAFVGSLQSVITTVGYITYDQEKLVHIHPRVQGWIEKLYINAVGDSVKKGQALYEIYSPELVNAQEELLLALNRNNDGLIRGAENRLIALQIPKNAIKNLKATKKVQQTITFYAPQSGVVEALNIREGFFVKPGSTLLSIGDLSEVWLETEVFENQAGQVRVDMPVSFNLDYLPGKTWHGRVDFVYPTLDAKTRTIKVRSRFSNESAQFKPNMFAQVSIKTSSDEQVLLIPKEALIRTGKQDRVVLALGQGSFKSIAVTTGRFDDQYVEIIQGLSEGENIVSSAQFLLDSESSKTSDFERMQSRNDTDLSSEEHEAPSSVWVQATIDSIMTGHNMVTLTHEPISQWNWPEMTMDFIVTDAVDLSQLYEGLSLHVEVSKTKSGDYQITNIHLPYANTEKNQVSSATVTGTINSLMVDHGMVNISRSAIEKWNRPAATVDFITDDNVSLLGLTSGMQVKFTFEVREGNFIITQINEFSDNASVDHSNHK